MTSCHGRYSFVHADIDSSIYSALCEMLLQKRRLSWLQVDKSRQKFHLYLGQRQNIPYFHFGYYHGIQQMVNYYRGHGKLCRKAELARTIRNNVNIHQDISWFPCTYIIYPQPEGTNQKITDCDTKSVDRQGFLLDFKARTEKRQPNIWIAKATTGAKGKDIVVSDDDSDLLSYIDSQSTAHVIQKYIENPLLLDAGRKFDMRCWVLLDPDYKVYLFKEGVLRTSSEAYQPENLHNITSHITNHCLQKELSSNFGKYEEENEIFFEQFDKYLTSTRKRDVASCIIPQVNTIVSACITSVKEQLSTDGLPYKSFQIYGFDFLIDEDLKVWLIEINGAPACAQRLQSRLVTGLLQMVIDKTYPPHPDDIKEEDATEDFIEISI